MPVYTTRKVAIIGAGYVGASIAYALTIKNIAREIVLIDVDVEKAYGEAKDIKHGIPYMGVSKVYAGDYCDCTDCDMIIITAGINRKPGQTRLELLDRNSVIITDIINKLKRVYTRGVILIVTNPVDVLVYKCSKMMDLPNGKIFGTGCILDTSRLISKLSDYLGIETEAIKAVVAGEHGDLQVPVWSRVSVAGIPVNDYCSEMGIEWNDEIKDDISSSVKQMGAEIIRAKGKTYYGIATCVCSLAEAVLNQRLTIASVCSPLCGEFGISDVALSVPSIIGVNGVEKRIEEQWTEYEQCQLIKASEKLQHYRDEE